jgi:hypothetical protein
LQDHDRQQEWKQNRADQGSGNVDQPFDIFEERMHKGVRFR